MTCKELRDLLPDIINKPGKYPEAEAHMEHCADCREEFAFLQELHEGIRVTLPDPDPLETAIPKWKTIRRLRWERSRRPMLAAISLVAVMALTLILPGIFTTNDLQFYADYDTETENVLASIDIDEGFQISTDEIAMYLLEHADMETIEELGLENYQVKI